MNENKCSYLAREAAMGADNNQLTVIYNKHEANVFGSFIPLGKAITGDEPIYTWSGFESQEAILRCLENDEVWTIEWHHKYHTSQVLCVHAPTLKEAFRLVKQKNDAIEEGD